MSGDVSLGQLTAKLGLNSASLEAGAGKAKQTLQSIGADADKTAAGMDTSWKKTGGAVAAGIAAIGIAAAAFALKSSAAFQDVGLEVMQLQKYTGGTAEEMSKLRFAAQRSGVDADGLSQSLKFLSVAVNTNKAGFEKYGISTLDASGKTRPLKDILYSTADVFKGMPNGVEKTALAVQLFGRSGADMIPMLNKGREGLVALEREATKYGLVLTRDNIVAVQKSIAAQREQTAAMEGFQVQIGQHVLPIMTKLTKATTEGLVAVMPLVSSIITGAVIPALSALSSVLGGALGFVEKYPGPVKLLAGVVAAALVPALLAWAAAQAKAIATSVVEFLAVMSTNAVRAAGSMNLMTGSLQAGTAKMTGLGIATGGLMAVLGVLYMEWQRQKAAARDWANKLVEAAKSPEEAIATLRAELQRADAELDKHSKSLSGLELGLGRSSKGYREAGGHAEEAKRRIKELTEQQAAAGDTAESLAAGLTQSGLAVQEVGGKTQFTAGRVRDLAMSMKVDLSKATSDQRAAMIEQAQRLGVTKVSTLKLADANKTLSDWTKDITAKTSAFSAALDALIGDEVSAARSAIDWQAKLGSLGVALKENGAGMDRHTEKGRANETAMLDLIDATTRDTAAVYKQSGSMDQAKAAFNSHIDDLRRTAQQGGMTTAQIDALIRQYNLTPDRLNTIVGMTDQATPPIQNVQRKLDEVKQPVAPTVSVQDRASGPLDNILGKLASIGRGAVNFLTTGFGGHEDGGIVRQPTLGWTGEGYKPEAVVPMTNPARARQVLTEAGLQNLFTGGSGSSSGATATAYRSPGQPPGPPVGHTTNIGPINAHTDADASQIAAEIAWQIKTSGI